MQQSDSLPLKGRVALVTGASRGIGRASARRSRYVWFAPAHAWLLTTSAMTSVRSGVRNALWTIVRRPVV